MIRKLLAVLIGGTVMNLITVPFLFSQNIIDLQKLSFSKHEPEKLNTGNFYGCKIMQDWKFDSTKVLSKDTVITKKTSKKEFHMKKSPWLAVLFSAVIPGAGQFYNQSYWKVPFIVGLSGYLVYEIYDNNKTFHDYRDQYSASQIIYPPYGDLGLLSLREFYRNQRDDFIWYFMIVYVVNLVDAYVDAHLFDFDVKEDKIQSSGKVDRKFDLRLNINF